MGQQVLPLVVGCMQVQPHAGAGVVGVVGMHLPVPVVPAAQHFDPLREGDAHAHIAGGGGTHGAGGAHGGGAGGVSGDGGGGGGDFMTGAGGGGER